jgi:hypothetical protein
MRITSKAASLLLLLSLFLGNSDRLVSAARTWSDAEQNSLQVDAVVVLQSLNAVMFKQLLPQAQETEVIAEDVSVPSGFSFFESALTNVHSRAFSPTGYVPVFRFTGKAVFFLERILI